jgi:hypothetical protein
MNLAVDKLIIGNTDAALYAASDNDIPILIFPERQKGELVSARDWKDWEMNVFCLSMSGVSKFHDRIQMIEVHPDYSFVTVFTPTGQYDISYKWLYIASYSGDIKGIDYLILDHKNTVIDVFSEDKIKKIFDGEAKLAKTQYVGAFEKFIFTRKKKINEITTFSSLSDEELHSPDNGGAAIRLYLGDFFAHAFKLRNTNFVHEERFVVTDIQWRVKSAPSNVMVFNSLQFPFSAGNESQTKWFVRMMWKEINRARPS